MNDFLIITSKEDVASMNIRENLLNSDLFKFELANYKWKENPLFVLQDIYSDSSKSIDLKNNKVFLGLIDERLIFLYDLELEKSSINPDVLIFASRHTSKELRPAFLVHTTGNWSNDANFGGNPKQISRSSALMVKAGFLSLEEQKEQLKNLDFLVDLEVSHHGPTNLEKPVIFMELGSSKKEWIIKEAAKIVANSIINAIFKYLEFKLNKSIEIGIGFGGTHYAPQFKKLILEKKIAISFICPKYFVQELNEDIITQMINKNAEKIDYFVIDWKGINAQDKNYLIPLLEEFDIPIKKTKDF